jgi:hypothetical protein
MYLAKSTDRLGKTGIHSEKANTSSEQSKQSS